MKTCELVLNEGIKRSIVAEKLKTNVVVLYRWIDKYQIQGAYAFVDSGHMLSEDVKFKRLEKVKQRLRMENEIFIMGKAVNL